MDGVGRRQKGDHGAWPAARADRIFKALHTHPNPWGPMLITLLGVTLLVAVTVSALVARLFAGPIRRIMERIVPDDISGAWVRYLIFAMFVVGIAGGTRIYQIERYLTPQGPDGALLELTGERWALEVYSSAIGALSSVTWMLLVFFVFALVAYVVVRAFELKRDGSAAAPPTE